VNDDPVACRSEVDYFAYRCGILVPRHNDGAGPDLPWVAGLIKESPGVTAIVFVVEIRGDVHPSRFILAGRRA
jgi:hypothetical protein